MIHVCVTAFLSMSRAKNRCLHSLSLERPQPRLFCFLSISRWVTKMGKKGNWNDDDYTFNGTKGILFFCLMLTVSFHFMYVSEKVSIFRLNIGWLSVHFRIFFPLFFRQTESGKKEEIEKSCNDDADGKWKVRKSIEGHARKEGKNPFYRPEAAAEPRLFQSASHVLLFFLRNPFPHFLNRDKNDDVRKKRKSVSIDVFCFLKLLTTSWRFLGAKKKKPNVFSSGRKQNP